MTGLIVTKEGTLPLLSPNTVSSGWKDHAHRPWSSNISSNWITFDTGATSSQPSNNRFCLKSSPKGNPKGAVVCEVAAAWPTLDTTTHASSSLEDSASVSILRSPSETTSKSNVRGKKKESTATSWWDDHLIDVNNDVTLALTLQITASHMKEKSVVQSLLALTDSNIFMWGGRQPSVLLIHVDSSVMDPELLVTTIEIIKDTFAHSSKSTSSTTHLQNSLIAVVESNEGAVSRKALMNMASNAAPTRWIVSGLELERGLVLSQEASVYAMREAKVYAELPGHVFVLPQFASKRDDTRIKSANDERAQFPEGRLMFSSIGADLLPTIKGKQSMTSNLSEYDCVTCEAGDELGGGADEHGVGGGEQLTDDGGEVDDEIDDGADQKNRRRLEDFSSLTVEEQIEDLWWDLSIADVYGTPGGFNGQAGASLDAIAKIHDRIEVSLISLLDRSERHLDYLRHFDKSPILMIDRLGPSKEVMTLDSVPEVEEFGGRTCFNLLRLSQLATLGYKVGVLPGAFAASYPKTRAAVCTDSIVKASRHASCDCDLDSESAIKEILMDEVKRVAKVTVLLREENSRIEAS